MDRRTRPAVERQRAAVDNLLLALTEFKTICETVLDLHRQRSSAVKRITAYIAAAIRIRRGSTAR
jgi:hypothetical protein